MKHRSVLLPCLVSGLVILSLATDVLRAASPASATEPVLDLSEFVAQYYRHPAPERIADVIRALQASGFAERPNARPPFIGFFAEIFSANPERLAEWRQLVAGLGKPARTLLEEAQALTVKGGVKSVNTRSPGTNDMYWGAFFATGNPEFLKRLIEQLSGFDERDDINLFWTGGTARWSLASNAQSHPLVRATLEAARIDASPRVRQIIEEILVRDQAELREELNRIYQQQKLSGKWK